MFILIKLDDTNTKILESELLKVAPTPSAENHLFVYTTEDETEINKLLNDYEKVSIDSIVGTTITFNFDSASEDPSARKIEDANWKYRVRPAFMRAATTTSMFNL